ncbi:MAG: hypothetical protein ACOCTT_01280 [archaeon]
MKDKSKRQFTTITITREVYNRLSELGDVNHSYNDVLENILDEYEGKDGNQ